MNWYTINFQNLAQTLKGPALVVTLADELSDEHSSSSWVDQHKVEAYPNNTRAEASNAQTARQGSW
jgi:hypothetical protein